MLRGKILALLAGLAVVLGITVAPAPPATAANAANFDAGNIISDALFYDGAAMTSSQIQSFLDKQIGRCSSNDCINILRTNISSRAARISDTTGNLVCKAFTGGTNLLVSEVIYRSQVACGISAKVILATLQKEQGLVTSKDPSPHNLNYAMGQACPDTAPCDPAFKGVGVQILAGTTQLKTYKAARFGRQPGTHNILYNPSSSCGTKRVEVKNYATAALYNYTPYTPNAAALEKLYGSGNSCSSYGNRNFWRDYTDWFGSTQAASASVSSIDTVPHVLALDTTGELWAYPSNGKGKWLPRVSVGDSWEGFATLLAPGDLDGDGHRDLITASSTGVASLHRGDGELGYEEPTPLEVNWSGVRALTAAGDFSGDGNPDVFGINAAGDLLLWRGTDVGGLRGSVKAGSGWQNATLIVGAGDFDGDGRADLLARGTNGVLILHRGNGKGGWLGTISLGSGWGSLTAIAVPGDFDGDGRQDIVARTNTGVLRLYAGAGNGRVKNGVQIGTGWGTFRHIVGAGDKASRPRATSPGFGDLDSDGLRDVVSRTAAGTFQLSRGNGAGGLTSTGAVTTAIPATSRVFPLGDFNGDGVADLGAIGVDGMFAYYAGHGAGDFRPGVDLGTGWGSLSFVTGGLDWDGDGHMDVLARTNTGELRVYRGNGAGGWAAGGVQIGSGWGSFTAIFPGGDFDGDGTPDVFARRADGTLVLYPTDGVGHWRSARVISTGWGGLRSLFSPGDFDYNGTSDLIGRRADGTLVLYKGNGKGAFVGNTVISSGWDTIIWID